MKKRPILHMQIISKKMFEEVRERGVRKNTTEK